MLSFLHLLSDRSQQNHNADLVMIRTATWLSIMGH